MISQSDRPPTGHVAIRALRVADAAACVAFGERLDPHDIRMRFASQGSATAYFLPERALADGRVAFAAVDAARAILGVVNLAYTNSVSAEIGVAVRSDRQRRGIGRALLAHAIGWAEADGLSHLVGYVLAENRPMLTLAQSMGFRRTRQVDFFIEVGRPIACRPT